MKRITRWMMVAVALAACSALGCEGQKASSSDSSGRRDAGLIADSGAEDGGGQADAQPGDTAIVDGGGGGSDGGPRPDSGPPVSDPLCPDGLACTDISGGYMACLQAGEVPAGAQTDCHKDGVDCSKNQACMYTDQQGTASVCIQNCGTCPSGTTCDDVTGDGYLGCLASGDIPAGAESGCHSKEGGCSGNATCFYINEARTESVCIQNCSGCKPGTCPAGQVCQDGFCVPEPCTADSCPSGEVCANGRCVPDIGDGPGPDTVGDCVLPPLNCNPQTESCGQLITFDPRQGDGYDDYPLNGETTSNQYRSYLRRDAVIAIKYAAAKVACKAKNWSFGNGGPIGLGDMSESNGGIPGTSVGQPGHPAGTHTNGFDIDLGYFQVNTADNRLRPICDHTQGGSEAYHCTATPHLLDPWRTALFIGALFESNHLRVIGVDGKAGPILDAALSKLCNWGWLPQNACSVNKMTYEETNEGRGWYAFHHHHFHVSFSKTPGSSITMPTDLQCLTPGCDRRAQDEWSRAQQRPRLERVPLGELTPPSACK